jgi:hypothetical protein
MLGVDAFGGQYPVNVGNEDAARTEQVFEMANRPLRGALGQPGS